MDEPRQSQRLIEAAKAEIGPALREARLAAGMTQLEVANATDGVLSEKTVQAVESGARRDMRLSTVIAYCQALDLTVVVRSGSGVEFLRRLR